MSKTLLILLFFLLFFKSFSQSGFQITKDKSRVVIPFKLINNLIFIPLELNGEELTFLLDTGVEETILFSLEETNQVSLKDVEVIKLKGLGGSEAINGYKSSNNNLSIKELVDTNHSLYIVLDQDFNFSSHVGIPVNGILGYKFFKSHLIEIDYSRKKLYVYAKNHKVYRKLKKDFFKDSITIELNKPYVFNKITNKGFTKRSKLLIDSGNSEAVWVFNNEKIKIPLSNNFMEDFLGRGFNGNIYGKRSRVDEIEFGGYLFKEALTNFTDSLSTQNLSFVDQRVGSIGGEILSRFNLFIDYPNQAIYTKPNKTIDDPFNFNMSGIEVEHSGLQWIKKESRTETQGIKVYTDSNAPSGYVAKMNNVLHTKFDLIPIFKILNVRPDSEADKVGLKKGDRILTINNKDTERFTIQKIHELLKSEDGKVIQIKVERNGIEIKFKFQLKKIL